MDLGVLESELGIRGAAASNTTLSIHQLTFPTIGQMRLREGANMAYCKLLMRVSGS